MDVPQSTVELNRLRRSLANGRLKDNGTDQVKIVLEDGTAYPQEGSLKFRDVTVDPTTGSVILRIVVPNPEGSFCPACSFGRLSTKASTSKPFSFPSRPSHAIPRAIRSRWSSDREVQGERNTERRHCRAATDRDRSRWRHNGSFPRGLPKAIA